MANYAKSFNIKNEINWPTLESTSKPRKFNTSAKNDVSASNTDEVHCLALEEIPHEPNSVDLDKPVDERSVNKIIHTANVDIQNISNNKYVDTRTREEILKDRKIRHKIRKQNARLLKFEEKRLEYIAVNKSKSISIINKETMNNILSAHSNEKDPVSHLNINSQTKNASPNATRNVKTHDPVQIDISAMMQPKLRKPKVNPINHKEPVTTCGNNLDSDKPQMQRGKKYENKKKSLTTLKKKILLSRMDRKQSAHSSNDEPSLSNNDFQNSHFKEIELNEINSRLQQISVNAPDNPENVSTNLEQIPSRTINECSYSTPIELKNALKALIDKLFCFQDRAYKKNPLKANMKRRYVTGFREVLKNLKLNYVCMIIIATDIEEVNCKGGLGDIMLEIENITKESNVPLIYAFKRREIGYFTRKKVGASCIAILNREGAEELFTACVDLHRQASQNEL